MRDVDVEELIEVLKERNVLEKHRNTLLSKIYDVLFDIYGGMP